MNKERIKEFMMKIIKHDMSLKGFAEQHGFNTAIFNMAINGHTNLREEYQDAINKFMGKNKP